MTGDYKGRNWNSQGSRSHDRRSQELEVARVGDHMTGDLGKEIATSVYPKLSAGRATNIVVLKLPRRNLHCQIEWMSSIIQDADIKMVE